MREMVDGQRLAIAAVALYVVVTLGVAVPPNAGRLAVLVLPGVVLMIIGVRSNLAVLVGAALALAGAGWSVRPVLDAGGLGAEAGDGRWLSAVLLGVGLLGCFELARLAVDAGPRHGPVRVEAALRRATERRFGMVAGLGVVGGGGRLRGDRRRALDRAQPLPPPRRAGSGRGGGRGGRAGPRRPPERGEGGTFAPAGPSRQMVLGLVVAGALALPALAALGAVAPLPGATSPAAERAGHAAEVAPEQAPPVTDPFSTGEHVGEGMRSRWVALGIVVLLAGVALLLLGGERMVSADDLRPDVAPPDDLLVGAPSAPDVRSLPPQEAAAVLEDALGYLRADLEPRLAVRCAYAAVAGGLGRASCAAVPRRPSWSSSPGSLRGWPSRRPSRRPGRRRRATPPTPQPAGSR